MELLEARREPEESGRFRKVESSYVGRMFHPSQTLGIAVNPRIQKLPLTKRIQEMLAPPSVNKSSVSNLVTSSGQNPP